MTSSAEREAAIEFAKAGAVRPQIVGDSLQYIARDPDVLEAMFEILETQKVASSHAKVTLLPEGGNGLFSSLLASQAGPDRKGPPAMNG
jgi:hypothetical protein